MNRIRARRWLLVAGALVILLAALAWGATRPRVANHFSYALPGPDGLPTYIYANGRRYQSIQVCAGADWCAVDRAQWSGNVPRCYTQSDLARMRTWPLVFHHWMFTFFGAPHAVMQPQGAGGVMTPFVIDDGPNCYVVYELEGGP
jgi:hypothetical protein